MVNTIKNGTPRFILYFSSTVVLYPDDPVLPERETMTVQTDDDDITCIYYASIRASDLFHAVLTTTVLYNTGHGSLVFYLGLGINLFKGPLTLHLSRAGANGVLG